MTLPAGITCRETMCPRQLDGLSRTASCVLHFSEAPHHRHLDDRGDDAPRCSLCYQSMSRTMLLQLLQLSKWIQNGVPGEGWRPVNTAQRAVADSSSRSPAHRLIANDICHDRVKSIIALLMCLSSHRPCLVATLRIWRS